MKLIMYGLNPKHRKYTSGVDSDSLRKKIAHPLSEDRAISKKVKTDLKFGMSKESPFLNFGNVQNLVHPSTKVIFGIPDKKTRPYTSKVNSMLRKSMNVNKGHIKVKSTKANDPKFQNVFTQFANCSMSPEKQKIVSFYSSASTLKGLRKKVAKGKFNILLIFNSQRKD